MKQEWIAKQIRMEVIVGTFVLAVLLGLGYFTIILSRDTWFAPKQKIEVLFPHVAGLREGDGVVVRGMTVGKVDSLALAEDGVHVGLAMDEAPRLREGYHIEIVPTSVLGGLYLEIDEGPDDAPPVKVEGVLRGESPKDLIGDAADVLSSLKKGLTEGGIIDNLSVTLSNIRTMTDRLANGEGTLGKLLSSDDKLYQDLSATAGSLRELTGRLEAGEGTLGKLLSKDDQLYQDVSAVAGSLREITSRVEEGQGTIGKLLSKDDQLYQDLAATTKSLRTIAERIENGTGVIGKLVSDEKLGTDVQETITELRATIDDVRETSPVVTFTSIFFGAL